MQEAAVAMTAVLMDEERLIRIWVSLECTFGEGMTDGLQFSLTFLEHKLDRV